MGIFKPLASYSSFRRIALAQWEPPGPGVIFGTMNMDVTEAEPFLEKLKEKHGQRVSLGVLVGKAVAIALRAIPDVNARVIGRKIYVKETVDVAYQVDVEGGRDLSLTVVNDADKMSLAEIGRELHERAGRIRTGKDEQYEKTQKRGIFKWAPIWLLALVLKLFSFLLYRVGVPASWLGGKDRDPFGSVWVTNVGRFGIDVGYAPLVPWTRVPIILLVGQSRDEAVVRNGEIQIRRILPVNATIDHRIADGAHIGRLSQIVRTFVEHPNEEGTVVVDGKTYGSSGAADG